VSEIQIIYQPFGGLPDGAASILAGTLARLAGRKPGTENVTFQYSDEWLGLSPRVAFQLDPGLPLMAGRNVTGDTANLLPLCMQDCSPDRWGKQLMQHREFQVAKKSERSARTLRDWDFLTGVSDISRMGALRLFEPQTRQYISQFEHSVPVVSDLDQLSRVALKVDRGELLSGDDAQWLRRLIAPGSALGGARPKAVFAEADGQMWLAKFPAANDQKIDVGLWEFITWELAIKAGIDMPPAKALSLRGKNGPHTFAVQRFDRVGAERVHFQSAMSMLGYAPNQDASYLEIADALAANAASGQAKADLAQLFRRVVFNIIVGNRDDHLRNHGFLRGDNGWRLSPAFDVNPNPYKRIHALAIDEGDMTPDLDAAVRTHAYYQLTIADARLVVDEVKDAMKDWQAVARSAGAKPSQIQDMRQVINC